MMCLFKPCIAIVATAAAAGLMAIPNPARADALRDAAAVRRDLNVSIRATAAASRTAEGKLSATEAAALRRIAANFSRTANEGALLASWRRLIAAMSPAPIDPNGLVQLVLRDSYLDTMADLANYAAKVKRFNHMKSRIQGGTGTPVTAVRAQDRSSRLAGAALRSRVQSARKLLLESRRIKTDLYNAALSTIRARHRGMTRGLVRPPRRR